MILHSINKHSTEGDKQLIRVKCDAKFERNEVDCKLAILKSKGPGDWSDVFSSNSEYDSAMVDYHWVTDSVYMSTILPLSIYALD